METKHGKNGKHEKYLGLYFKPLSSTFKNWKESQYMYVMKKRKDKTRKEKGLEK